jgi:hypothetical protein
MYEPDDSSPSRSHQDKEYQDCHFHDDDEIIPADEESGFRKTRPPGQRKSKRRLPPRRHFEAD